MALFGKKKETAPAEEKKVVAPAVSKAPASARGLSHVIANPRITEKATMHEAAGVYTFDVFEGANKREIMQAVRELYKVTPRKVSVVTIPRKEKRNVRTGRSGMRGGGKKAYVYLKKGDTITLH